MVTTAEFHSPYYNLKSLIERKGYTQASIAKLMGIDRVTFNVKLNRANGRDFTFQEAIKLAKILDEKIEYFFWSLSFEYETRHVLIRERSENWVLSQNN